MRGTRSKTIRQYVYVGLLVLAAYACRLPGMLGLSETGALQWVNYVRSAIYVVMFALWGVSVSQRVIDPHIRGRLATAAALMVFWIVVRSVKFLSPESSALGRYCWYLYYIPMLFVPLMTSLIAAFMGRTENTPLPRWGAALYIIAGAAALLVLTNDLHGLVFVFPDGLERYVDGKYSYGPGFLLPAAWRYSGLLATLCLVFFRSRLPNRGRLLLAPIIPAALLVAYHGFYLSGARWLRVAFGDMTVTECLLVMCILEACLATGLIQSNTRYIELFHGSGTGAVILDRGYGLVAAADNYTPLPEDVLRSAEGDPVMLENNIRLSSAPIARGWVFWTEDVSELAATTERLREVEAFLSTKRDVAEREMESSRRKHRVIARKSLYDSVMSQTEEEIRRYGALVASLENETDPELIRRAVLRITVICAYIKRKISLIFQARDDGEISGDQFDICVTKDTLPCICGGGAAGDYSSSYRGSMPVRTAIALYKAHCTAALDTLESIGIALDGRKDAPVLRLRIVCDNELSPLARPNVHVERDGREWTVTVMPEGGYEL